jgi:hypothetical protein
MSVSTFTYKGAKVELEFSSRGRPKQGETADAAYARREKAAKAAYRAAH